ncbi:DUF4082 domain-containing protein [Microbacterium sp.]|uniref:DUF4082 domain-containing protein n=1 Tax=Microbacterium sp. TaxID=51671 RepID=UPI0028A91723|nr:DUF4082 domain-containing protein [Microbacterium sp.]
MTYTPLNTLSHARRSSRGTQFRGRWTARITAAVAVTVAALIGGSSLAAAGATTAAPTGVLSPTEKPAITADSDRASAELGVKFTVADAGTITGVKFYATPANAGPHVGSLWDQNGKQLATATFPSTTTAGWVSASFATPVDVKPGQTYVASYLAPSGGYAVTQDYFTTARSAAGVTFPKNAGVYRYGAKGGFPTQTYKASNYFVDVLYAAGAANEDDGSTTTPPPTAPEPTPPTTSPAPSDPVAPSAGKNCIEVPSACGYPDETNTGPGSDVKLTRVPEDATSGPGWTYRSDIRAIQTTSDKATLANLSLGNGSVIVQHPGVTLRNLYIRSNDYYPVNCTYSGATRDADSCLGLTVENTEIAGTTTCQAGLAFSGYTARAVHVHGCADGFKANSDVLIENSYVTDLGVSPGSHNDGVQSTASGNLTVRHSTFKLGHQSDINAVFQMGVTGGNNHGVTIENNLIDGGGWMLNSRPIPDGVVKDNRFTRRSTWGIGFVDGASWTGNYWDDTLAPIAQNN